MIPPPRGLSYPLPLRERVVSSVSENPGEGSLSIDSNPSPSSNFAEPVIGRAFRATRWLIRATLSRKGKG